MPILINSPKQNAEIIDVALFIIYKLFVSAPTPTRGVNIKRKCGVD